jgi:hypothetical protein
MGNHPTPAQVVAACLASVLPTGGRDDGDGTDASRRPTFLVATVPNIPDTVVFSPSPTRKMAGTNRTRPIGARMVEMGAER